MLFSQWCAWQTSFGPCWRNSSKQPNHTDENTRITNVLHWSNFPETLHTSSDLFEFHTHANALIESDNMLLLSDPSWKQGDASCCYYIDVRRGFIFHRWPQSLSVFNRNTVHQLFPLDMWVPPSLSHSMVQFIPNTWLAILALWMPFGSR